MTSVARPLQTRRQDPRARVRTTRNLLLVTAVLEGGFGVALLIAPAWVAHLLAGLDRTSPELAAILRVAGGLLIAIGIWCALGRLSESGTSRSRPLDLVPGLVVYNGCAVAVIADGLGRGLHAPLLWPALAVHSVLFVWCVACLARERAVRR
jgi:hypothetical protein